MKPVLRRNDGVNAFPLDNLPEPTFFTLGSMPTILETSSTTGLKRLYYLSLLTAVISGVFCAFFFGLLLQSLYFGFSNEHPSSAESIAAYQSSNPSYRQPSESAFHSLPTDNAEFLALKHHLTSNRQDEESKTNLRTLDKQLRADYFSRRAIVSLASRLLCVALIVFLIAVKTVSVLKRRLPVLEEDSPKRRAQIQQERFRLSTTVLAGLTMLLLGWGLGLALAPSSSINELLEAKLFAAIHAADSPDTASASTIQESAPETTGTTSVEPETEPPMDREAFVLAQAAAWPSFRGHDGSSTARCDQPPVRWDAVKGDNLLWKTQTVLPGKSSPVVWGERLFLTGADQTRRQVYCFDIKDGRLLWTTDAPSTPESEKPFEISEDTGFAAPTMALDGRRAFAVFANGDLVALDFQGKVLWSHSLGMPESAYGYASSPTLYFDLLIIQYDIGSEANGSSKLMAFDVRTGQRRWSVDREIPNSWSSPIVVKIENKYQLITCGDPFVISYDPETGTEIWRCKCLANDVGPSPVAYGKCVFVANQAPRATAIDATGTGEVTQSHILWQGINALPDTVSPWTNGERFFTLDSHGYMTAYDPTQLKRNNRAACWELELGAGEASFYSTPLLVGSLVYAFDKSPTEPRAFVIDLSKAQTDDAGALLEEAAAKMIIATNPMPEPCVASPAMVDNRLFIRGTQFIYCISEQK